MRRGETLGTRLPFAHKFPQRSFNFLTHSALFLLRQPVLACEQALQSGSLVEIRGRGGGGEGWCTVGALARRHITFVHRLRRYGSMPLPRLSKRSLS